MPLVDVGDHSDLDVELHGLIPPAVDDINENHMDDAPIRLNGYSVNANDDTDDADIGRYTADQKCKGKRRDLAYETYNARFSAEAMLVDDNEEPSEDLPDFADFSTDQQQREQDLDRAGPSSCGDFQPTGPQVSSDAVYVRYGRNSNPLGYMPSRDLAVDAATATSITLIPELESLMTEGSVAIHTHVFPSLYQSSPTEQWLSCVALNPPTPQADTSDLPLIPINTPTAPPPPQRFKRPRKPGMFFISYQGFSVTLSHLFLALAFKLPDRFMKDDVNWFWKIVGAMFLIAMAFGLVIVPILTLIINFTFWLITRSRVRALRRWLYSIGTAYFPTWLFHCWAPQNYVWFKAINVEGRDTYFANRSDSEEEWENNSFYTDDSNFGTWYDHVGWILRTTSFKITPLILLIAIALLTMVLLSTDMSSFWYWMNLMLIFHFAFEIPYFIYKMDIRDPNLLFARYDSNPHFNFIWDSWQDAVHKYLRVRPNIPLREVDVPCASPERLITDDATWTDQDAAQTSSASGHLRSRKSPFPTEQSPAMGWSLAQISRKLFILDDGHPNLKASRGTICGEGTASVHSVELFKFTSWKYWKHEFLVLKMTYGGTIYIFHINRTWDPSGSSIIGGYAPSPNWEFGSQKPVDEHNQITIFRRGEKEEKEREGTRLIARAIFRRSDVKFWHVIYIMLQTYKVAGSYALFGANCWAWSRSIMKKLISNHPLLGHVESRPMWITLLKGDKMLSVDRFELEEFLTDSWTAPRTRLDERHVHELGLATSASWKEHMYWSIGLAGPNDPRISYRQNYCREHFCVISSTATLMNGVDVTYSGSPHNFIRSPFFLREYAVYSSKTGVSNSLCGPGDFLYLMTPPLHLEKGRHLRWVDCTVEASIPNPDSLAGYIPLTVELPCFWIELGLVRLNSSGDRLIQVGDRILLPTHDNPDLRRSDLKKFVGLVAPPEYTTRCFVQPPLNNFAPGDMLGMWIRVTCSAVIAIEKATIDPVFDLAKARALDNFPGPSRRFKYNLDDGSNPVEISNNPLNLCTCYDANIHIFKRQEEFHVTASKSVDSGGNCITIPGSPHNFDVNGNAWAIEDDSCHDRSAYISLPGSLLYLLTPGIFLTPDLTVVSITLVALGHQGNSGATGSSYFQVTLCRFDHRSGQFGVVNPSIGFIPHALQRDGMAYRHEKVFTTEHPLLQEWKNGDMFAVWAHAEEKESFYHMKGGALLIEYRKMCTVGELTLMGPR